LMEPLSSDCHLTPDIAAIPITIPMRIPEKIEWPSR
jgi:hypothetical protein